MYAYTDEEIECGLPELMDRWGKDYSTDRGTEYHDGYDLTFRFGMDADGWSKDRVTVRYYY